MKPAGGGGGVEENHKTIIYVDAKLLNLRLVGIVSVVEGNFD